jgi:hypothetical protein
MDVQRTTQNQTFEGMPFDTVHSIYMAGQLFAEYWSRFHLLFAKVKNVAFVFSHSTD